MADFWNEFGAGVNAAINARTDKYLSDNTNGAAVSGNTGAYLGKSAVDTLAVWITAGADKARTSLVDRFMNSGTGSKIVAEARSQEINKWLANPVVWIVGVAILGAMIYIGRATR